MNPVHETTTCAVAASAEIIGAKWTALLVHDLSEGPRRFSQLEHSCAGITPRTLAERLRALEDEGIVVRQSYAESPPRVEYELTDKGARAAADHRRHAGVRPRLALLSHRLGGAGPSGASAPALGPLRLGPELCQLDHRRGGRCQVLDRDPLEHEWYSWPPVKMFGVSSPRG